MEQIIKYELIIKKAGVKSIYIPVKNMNAKYCFETFGGISTLSMSSNTFDIKK